MFTSLNVILGILPEAQTGAGSALTRTLSQLAASFGVAILGSILNNAYRAELADQLTALPARLRDVAAGSVAGASVVASHLPAPLGTHFLFAANDAYSVGMSEVLRICAGAMIVAGLLIATFLHERSRSSDCQPAASAHRSRPSSQATEFLDA
jgi:DHA2 family multidrug resistance protein-like MFS transporter